MKTCPFCREEVRDDATKCRFCASSLATPGPGPGLEIAAELPSPGPDQVAYILDKSLVRFGKFAGALLAVFALVGGVLWGFDVKQATDRVREMAEDVRKAQDDIREMKWKVRESQDQIGKDSLDIRRAAREVETGRKEVEAAQKEARAAMVMARREALELLEAIRKDAREADNYTELLRRGGPAAGLPQAVRTSSPRVALTPFTVPEVARLYHFPAEFDGTGQTIGLVELGGGYSESDLDLYFRGLSRPRPRITPISVGGSRNQPGTEADAQVTLDIEVAGSVAPAAHLVVYFAQNTNQGFIDAVNAAATDTVNRPSVLCISWGSTEKAWSPEMMRTMDGLLKKLAVLGTTVIASVGDRGFSGGIADGKGHVDFPASSPHVLAVGGTRLVGSAGAITSEVVWNGSGGGATGGGLSSVFERPDWQASAKVPAPEGSPTARGVPDVAANASPDTGYLVVLQGQRTQVGGTSATGPLWAGLIALINQGLGRNVGYLNPILYTRLGPEGVFRDIVEGNNGGNGVGGYAAGPGWDACTGWGTPDGRKLLDALRPR